VSFSSFFDFDVKQVFALFLKRQQKKIIFFSFTNFKFEAKGKEEENCVCCFWNR
jgi:hypothetical protein